MWIGYAGLVFAVGLFAGFIGAVLVATIMDWQYARKNRLWIELQRTNYNRRRAAK